MTSPTSPVSDLLATTASPSTNNTLDASTFVDPFSESNPFAEDSLGRASSPLIHTSRSLNFGEYYPQSTAPTSIDHGEDNHDPDRLASGSPSLYSATGFPKSFSAMNLTGESGSGHEETTTASSYYGGENLRSSSPLNSSHYEDQHEHDSDGGQHYGSGGHQRWGSVDSNARYDSDEQQASSYDPPSSHHREDAANYRPESTRSLGSQVKKE